MFFSDKLFNYHTFCICSAALVTLSGCSATGVGDSLSSTPSITPATYYDYNLRTSENKIITIQQFILDNKDVDIILVGEWHTHAGIHRFQSDLLRAMFNQNKNISLSMEQFSRDKQDVLNEYLAGETGEQILIKEAAAWPNYESDYRPLVEFSKTNNIDIIASNAPNYIVRCIGSEGIGYINKLKIDERAWLAKTITTKDSEYKKRFLASMHHGDEVQNLQRFEAQVTWDETMAESILGYLEQHPNQKIIHVAGKFHVEDGVGIAASINARAPHLQVVIITPIAVNETSIKPTTDYRLQVLDTPQRYVKHENMIASYADLSSRNQNLQCIK
jgi:uncharacterized iron-regulated protein